MKDRTGFLFLDFSAPPGPVDHHGPIKPDHSTDVVFRWGADVPITEGIILPSDIVVARDGLVIFRTSEHRSGPATWGHSVRAAQTRRIHRAMRRRERRARR